MATSKKGTARKAVSESTARSMKTQPLVTICVPVYNGERFLKEALDSILAQTYKNTEILILDNCSTDATPKITAKYEKKDPRVKVIRHKKNIGAIENWNYGIRVAKGSLIAIYHADDIFEKTILEEQVRVFTLHPRVSAVFTRSNTIDAQGKRIGADAIADDIVDRELSYEEVMHRVLETLMSPFISPSCIARKKSFLAAGSYNKRFDYAGDVEMYLRLAMVGNVYLIGKRLVNYRHYDSQGSILYSTTYTVPNQIFGVLDSLLKKKKTGDAKTLNTYEAYRDWDYSVCAINILAKKYTINEEHTIKRDERSKARKYLRRSLTWRRIRRAHKEPMLLGITIGMLIFTHLGIGSILARTINNKRRARHNNE